MSTADWLGIIGIVVGIAAIPITYFLGRRSRQSPDLRVAMDFDVLVSPEDRLLDRGLDLQFDKQPIERVSRTYVAFWNQRGDTVRGDDIVPSDPLRLTFLSNDEPLQVRLVSQSRHQIGFSAITPSDDKSVVLLKFDFLDAGDGGIFEVIHQGVSAPHLEGTLRGAKWKNRGDTELTATALDAIAEKSIARRFWTRVREKKKLGSLVISVFTVALPIVGAMVIFFTSRRKAELVKTTDFDLTTLNGQRDFANRVTDVGAYEQPRVLLPGFALLALISFATFLVDFVIPNIRSTIPRSIVSERLLRERAEDVFDEE